MKEGFLSSFSEETRARILRIATLKHFTKNEIIFFEGDEGHSFFLLSKGLVQITKSTAEGKEVVLKTLREGEIFAEVILFEKNTFPVTATAITNSEIFVIRKIEFLSLLDDQDFRNRFISSLIAKQRYLTEQIKYLTITDVEERFFTFLKVHYGNNKEIRIDMTKKNIAGAIFTTPETLSRLIQKLTDEKKICWEGKKIKILN